MEKIIKIDGRDIVFKSTGAAPLRYKAQFKRDFFADIMKLEKVVGKGNEVNVDYLDLETFYNIAWVFAKTADPTIKPPLEWLDDFSIFPIMDICKELQDLLINSLGVTNSPN